MTNILDNMTGDALYVLLVIKGLVMSILAHLMILGYWAWQHPLFACMIIAGLFVLYRQMKQYLWDMWFIEKHHIEELDDDQH